MEQSKQGPKYFQTWIIIKSKIFKNVFIDIGFFSEVEVRSVFVFSKKTAPYAYLCIVKERKKTVKEIPFFIFFFSEWINGQMTNGFGAKKAQSHRF